MDRLRPVTFFDAWGSHVALASLQGRDIPTPEPESELWMGAHESGPSGVERAGAGDLAALIAADPEGELGSACVAAYGPRLPFLLKVLAAGRALSIQVHPSAEQAVEARRRPGGADLYPDEWAKPELLLAVSVFEVFVGLQSFAEVRDTVEALGIEALSRIVAAAATEASPLHAVLSAVLHTPSEQRQALVQAVVAACVGLEGRDDSLGELCAAVARAAEEHPGDIGLVVLLLMNHRTLHPGEFIDVPAGVLHAYVRGLAVEVLANSDNVVRAGLTRKPVDVDELLRIVDVEADGEVGRPARGPEGVQSFATSSDRFRLHRVWPHDQVSLPGAGHGPRIAFCLRGSVRLQDTEGELRLAQAESAFIPAGSGPVTAQGGGELYVVSAPL